MTEVACQQALDEVLIRRLTDDLLTAKSRGVHVQAAKSLMAELWELRDCPLAASIGRALGRYVCNEEDLRFQEPGLK